MFNGVKNVVVNGGSFTANANSLPKGHLDKLIAEVAPNAILNAGGRADEVRCFPGTREEVIARLEQFMDDESPGRKRMMWLSGPAGAGKSAICQTVAERRDEQGRHAISFFFFRGDSTRSHRKPLVATLVYQLRRFYPTLDEPLFDRLEIDPLICSASIDAQFKQLISSPIQAIQRSTPLQQQIAIMIDGLDECKDERDQNQILVTLHKLAYAEHSPFLILVSSRAEPHLVMSFNRLGSSVESIFLSDNYKPQEDIRLFVVAKFDEIKKNHHLARTLSTEWPTDAEIDAITKKSSGQFIYAVTVMRYIQFSPSSPALSLATVLEMPPSSNHNPLAQVDAVYSYIFSKAHHIREVKLVLFSRTCYRNWWGPVEDPLGDLLQHVGYRDIEVQSFFADLAPIIQVVPGPSLVFYHASLEDYLEDKSRSTIFCVKENEVAAEFSAMCWRKLENIGSIWFIVDPLEQVEKPTPELSESLLEASTKRLSGKPESLGLSTLIRHVERLYWEHDNTQFKALLRSWSRFVHVNNLERFHYVDIRPQNPSASRYYKQYWMAEEYSQRKPLTPLHAAPARVARSNTQVTPVRASPNAPIGPPARDLNIRKPVPFSQNIPAAPSKGRRGDSTQAGVARTDTQIAPARASPNTAISSAMRGLSIRKPEPSSRNRPTVTPKGGGDDSSPASISRSKTLLTPVKASPNAAIGRGVSIRKPGASSQSISTGLPNGKGGSHINQPGSTSRTISTYKKEGEEHGSGEYKDGPYELRMIRIKLHYHDDIRVVLLNSDTPFSEFVDRAAAKFRKNFDDLTMKFKDKDGDKVTLCDDADYEHAIQTARESSRGQTEGLLEIWCKDSG